MPFFSFLNDESIAEDIGTNRPDLYQHLGALGVDILMGPSTFSAGEREFMGAFVSALNDCSFCHGAHRATAAAYGVDTSGLEALIADIDTAPVDERMKPVFKFLEKLTLTPARLVQGDADAVFDAGWSEEDLGTAIAVCAVFAFANRMVDGHGISRHHPQSTFDAIGKRFAESGYGEASA